MTPKKTKIIDLEKEVKKQIVKESIPLAKQMDEEIISNVLNERKAPKIKMINVSLRGKYLPNILVKLGEYSNNAEARRIIRNSGIKVNNQLIRDIDYRLLESNIIEVNNTVYNVRII